MAVDIFLKLQGINGESEDQSHSNEIDIIGWTWGMSNMGTAHMGGGAGTGKANFNDIAVTKYVDLASTSLLKACSTGKHVPEAVITVRKAGEKPLEYVVITMKKVFIANVQFGGNAGSEQVTEVITLNFAEIDFKYQGQGDTGSSDGSDSFKWNIPKNAAA